MKFRDENAILFFAALSATDDTVLARVGDAFGRGVDAAYLERMAAALDVSAGLLDLFRRAGIASDALPPGVRRAAAREFATGAEMERFCRDVSAIFNHEGIPYIPLKGADRRIAAGSRNLVNPMDDMDILVRDADIEAARNRLVHHGFLFLGARSGAHLNFALDGTPPRFLDLHWHLINQRSSVQRQLFRPGMDRIWQDAVPICGALHLSPEDLICHTLAHAMKEYFRKPRWLADAEYLLRAVLPGCDPGRMRANVAEWGVGSAFGMLALALDRMAGGSRLAEAERFGAIPPGFAGRHVAARVLDYPGARRRRPLVYAACVRSPVDGMRIAGGMVMHFLARKSMRRGRGASSGRK